MIKKILICLTFCAVNAAIGQNLSNGDVFILYKLDRTSGKYVLNANFQTAENDTISQIVIGDTFMVKSEGATCFVVMTNAYMLNTKYGRSTTNEINENKALFDVYVDAVPPDSGLIFDGSVYNLSKFDLSKIEYDATNFDNNTNTTVYNGKAALDQLNKMGLKPPDDMDMKKAIGE